MATMDDAIAKKHNSIMDAPIPTNKTIPYTAGTIDKDNPNKEVPASEKDVADWGLINQRFLISQG